MILVKLQLSTFLSVMLSKVLKFSLHVAIVKEIETKYLSILKNVVDRDLNLQLLITSPLPLPFDLIKPFVKMLVFAYINIASFCCNVIN